MAQIFPKWTNRLPLIVAALVLGTGGSVVGFFWYYGSPKYYEVGYRPVQPVPYSHKLHADDLGLDCRYCHTSVEVSAVSTIPPTQTCMNCHQLVLPQSEKLLPVRESWATGRPIEWTKVHKLPDFAYFNHSAHVRAGVGCVSCHGHVEQMEVVSVAEQLSMGWCLDCHRNPDPHLRPDNQITNMKWVAPANQAELAAQIKQAKKLNPPEDCSACHR